MAQAELKEVIDVPIEKFYSVIVAYETYPKFVEGCVSARVERGSPERAKVYYKVSLMKDIAYTLEHLEDRTNHQMSWKLLEGDTFKKNTGSWKLKSLGPSKTEVQYQLELEFNIPVPGFILNRLVKGNLPSMLKNFVQRAKST